MGKQPSTTPSEAKESTRQGTASGSPRGTNAGRSSFAADEASALRSLDREALKAFEHGDFRGAKAAFQRWLKAAHATQSVDHLGIATAMFTLATVERRLGDEVSANDLLRKAFDLRLKWLGPVNVQTISVQKALAYSFLNLGNAEQALPLLEKSVEWLEASLAGATGADREESLLDLASTLTTIGYANYNYKLSAERAESAFRKSILLMERLLDRNDPDLVPSYKGLGLCLRTSDKISSISLFERALAIQLKDLESSEPETDSESLAETLFHLGVLQEDHPKIAIPLLEQTITLLENQLGQSDLQVAWALERLAIVRCNGGDFALGRQLFRRALAIVGDKLGQDDVNHARIDTRLKEIGDEEDADVDVITVYGLIQRGDDASIDEDDHNKNTEAIALNLEEDLGDTGSTWRELLAAEGVPEERIDGLVADFRVQAARVARPMWANRLDHKELRTLTAPQFLKKVHAAEIGPDGSVSRQVIRDIDRDLLDAIDTYIGQRKKRNVDLGDAAGLTFLTTRAPQAKSNPAAAQPKAP